MGEGCRIIYACGAANDVNPKMRAAISKHNKRTPCGGATEPTV